MSKGLTLARTFYLAGHNVIGADFQPYGIPPCGRFSRALRKFYALPKPNGSDGAAFYINVLLRVVQSERVDLWVSCSGVASAVEDGMAKEVLERRSDCVCIQFDVPTTTMLHEKDTFIAETARLGLPVPETHNVTSRAAVHKVLNESPRTKKRYIMKSVGVDDSSRGNMTVLPKRTLSETYGHLSKIPIAADRPWVLQEFVRGKEYCTHALVVGGVVKAFVACPSLELLMHYEALPPDSALSKAMLRFTQEFVRRRGGEMTGHLSFDFLIEERITEKGVEMGLVPIECNPRAHTAVVLFQGQEKEMADAYLSALKAHNSPNINGYTNGDETDHQPLTPLHPAKYYWLPHDLITLILQPLLSLLLRRISLASYLENCRAFLEYFLLWEDGTYELWDPLPAWWLYHVYWPGMFLASFLYGRRWSRVNVSTGKVFEC
jgi:catechol O-methyltransferase